MERALKLALSKSQRSKTQEFSGILNSAHLILIDIESVADGFARGNKFWGISLEDFPRYNGRFAERLVAHVPVPLGDLAMLRLGIGLDPGAYFHGTGTLGDGVSEVIERTSGQIKEKVVERTIKMVFALPSCNFDAALVENSGCKHAASQAFTGAAGNFGFQFERGND